MSADAPPATERRHHRDERRVVTVLFADIVGSTPLAERLGAEEFRLVVGEATAAMIRAVETYGGTVSVLTGDGLLALFGAPIAREDDAERAVRAALDCLRQIAAYAQDVERGWGIPDFGVRIGVTTGETVVGTFTDGDSATYTAHGDAVNTAARLQGAAEPQQVLVESTTRRLAEHLFEWSGSRNLDLKGKAAPIEAFAALGIAAGAEAEQPAFDTPLVGRDVEMARLGDLADDLLAGRGGIMFLTGEAGIGKSRLIGELHRRLTSRSDQTTISWLEGDCASYGEDTPYWPFRRMIRRWLGASSDDPELRVRVALRTAVDGLFGGETTDIRPYLTALLGLEPEADVRARLEALSPEALQYRTFEVIGQLLDGLGEVGPVVVAIEDLHWADATSMQLIAQLASATERMPLLLILSSRLEPDHRSWSLRADLNREFPHNTMELDLATLPGVAERRLLEALVGEGTLPGHVERQVLAAAEGNPFYLEELIRSLIDAGAVTKEGASWRFDHAVPIEVPPTVERVILARADRLPADTRSILVAASVLGRSFTLPLLETAAGVDGNELPEPLHHLQRLGFLRETRRWPEPEYRFGHALIQDAVYHTLIEMDRVGLHERVARHIESNSEATDEAVGLLARHWSAAGNTDKAIEYLTLAGDQARTDYAIDEAIGHYRTLLPLLEEHDRRHDAALVLFKLALALHMTLRFEEANDVYQRAFEYWDGKQGASGEHTRVLRFVGSRTVLGPTPKSHSIGDINLGMAVFDRLVEALPEQTIVPSLAERWTISPDGLRYEVHLRGGLQWSDGTPLTAHDVEFGIKRILDPNDPGMSVAIFFVIENALDYYLGEHDDAAAIGVRALDDLTLEFTLNAPAPYFMWVLNRPDAAPQPRHVIDASGEDTVGRDVVSGPFRLLKEGDPLILERRDDYGDPRPGNVSRIEWFSLDEDTERRYLDGALDLVTSGFDHLPTLHLNAAEDERRWPPALCVYFAFDHDHELMGDVAFRRALAHAIDRDALADTLPPSWVLASGGLVPPPLQGHTPDIAPAFDPDRAVEFLASSGWSGESLVIPTAFEATEGRPLSAIAASWTSVLNVDARVEEVESPYQPDVWKPFGLVPLIWYPGYPDPEYFLRLLLHSASRSNAGGFSDARFDELVEVARQERSDRRRLEAFHEADRYAVAERAAVIPLWYASNVSYAKPHVRGWWEFGKSWPNFADLVIDEA